MNERPKRRLLVQGTVRYPLIWDENVGIDVLVEDQLFAVSFKRRFRKDVDPTLPAIAAADGVELLYDRFGRVAVTDFGVMFPMYYEDTVSALDKTLGVLNRFLEVYRFTTREYHVDIVAKHELDNLQIIWLNESDWTPTGEAEVLQNYGYGITLARTAITPMRAADLLASGEPLPMPDM